MTAPIILVPGFWLGAVMAANGLGWMEILAGDLDAEADVMELDNGWEFHYPLGVRLAQVIHHAADHRSQICTALTRLGHTPPEIDVWAFANATGLSRVVQP